ncbi:sterol desaturase [Aspergillus fumigatus]|nr:sterol desaturase [Aspergillus fumigatus]
MDVALEFLDPLILDKAYAWLLPSEPNVPDPTSRWDRDNVYRQVISILVLTQLGATSLYLFFSALSYYFVFDRRLEYHPRFLPNQVRQEIKSSLSAIPFINILTLPWFLAEVRGKSMLYRSVSDYGWPWLVVSSILYMAFNDIGIYWIHRLEHHPSVYKYIHKPHHKWIAILSAVPLTINSVFVFICPMQRHLYMVLFAAVQIWTILIHDGDMISGHWTEKFINSPAHHTLHHMYFTVNYGQYFTWADAYFGSHRAPEPALDPLHDALKVMRAKGLVDEQGNPIKKPKGE